MFSLKLVIDASWQTIPADFPPSSSTVGTIFFAAAVAIAEPVFTDPVKAIWLISS